MSVDYVTVALVVWLAGWAWFTVYPHMADNWIEGDEWLGVVFGWTWPVLALGVLWAGVLRAVTGRWPSWW